MTTIKATIDGEELEFEILNRNNSYQEDATHIIGNLGNIVPSEKHHAPEFTRLRLIRKRHTFGRVVFEETGERQTPHAKQWWLGGVNTPYPAFGGTHEVQTILRPVALEEQS